MASIDFFPTFCKIADIPLPQVDFDGEDKSDALLGKPQVRKKPIFWEYGREGFYLQPGLKRDPSPNLAVRDGNWKLLINADGTGVELYDLKLDRTESANLAEKKKKVTARLSKALLEWRKQLP